MMIFPTVARFDSWLEPYNSQLEQQLAYVRRVGRNFLDGKSIEDAALGHLYFGFHIENDKLVFREWAPNATAIYLWSAASNWQDESKFQFKPRENGVWELSLPLDSLNHGDHYKLNVHWADGSGLRLPAYTTYALQDDQTHNFNAVVWRPKNSYVWQHQAPPQPATPLIYEAHVGMSSEHPEVASYEYFRENVLPRIKNLGYNTVQLMAVQEHPYYGSFGYHVSNFFAASSRFGTPDDLKKLIDTAHGMGLRILLDIVHSHAVKNELEGLGRLDGSDSQYFLSGASGLHPAWDSRVFDYGKDEVKHFLLSNLRFWLDEYRFDGFRFDGVTSMLYHDHGLERNFTEYSDYFSTNTNLDALAYLRLATELVHKIRPEATLVAEEMSGFPGLAAPIGAGGYGFDYRLNMGVPDLWIKTLKENRDEDWQLGHLFHELTSHRPEEKTISYVESHDQAMVGDKTIIFRLADRAMYDHMNLGDSNIVIERAIALHKIIRLLTASTNSGGYLNFMGNEFGHPEWIDFPRPGNNWSYHYARRQWSLADNPKLKFHWLEAFDRDMISHFGTMHADLSDANVHESDRIISFRRDKLIFVFNFSTDRSYTDYGIPISASGHFKPVLSSDESRFGGQDRHDMTQLYETSDNQIKLYLPARTAVVLRQQ